MQISLVHFRVGELDGVSLEMDKWRIVLQKLDHEVSYLSGISNDPNDYTIPELSLDHEQVLKIQKNAFIELSDFTSEEELEKAISGLKNNIKRSLHDYLSEFEVEIIIPNNLFSLPMNLAASCALYEVIKENDLRGIFHSHDFYWERDCYNPTVPLIQDYLDEIFPPKLPKIKHVVINSLAQEALKRKKGIKATVVPNVFYFDTFSWGKDEFNSDLRKKLEIANNDIFVLQATRIVNRKGIELAIDLIKELSREKNLEKLRKKPLYDGRIFGHRNRFVLVMPNLVEDLEYKDKIESNLKKNSIKYCFCNEIFTSNRSYEPEKRYSLWDSYVHADIVTYPSFREGWGNQFLEAIKAKLPVVIFEYDVYKNDIAPMGFETVSLGSKIEGINKESLVRVPKSIMTKAAVSVIRLLQDSEYRDRIVEKNHAIGQRNFSLKALETYIKPLLKNM